MKLGVIGYGSIAKQALTALAKSSKNPLDLVAILARSNGVARAAALLDSLGPRLATQRIVVTDLDDLLKTRPALVAEAAGHESITSHGVAILSSGRDLVITSVGALANDRLLGDIETAARMGRARYHICPGAIGGLDIVAAAKLSGLRSLVYTSRKPPPAWRGTAADKVVDLNGLLEARVFFEGTARDAARMYPQNANVAATVALHGAGLDNTIVRLVADPGVTRNTHTLVLRSACADMEITIAGLPSLDNPKTSMTAGYALAAQIMKILDDRSAIGSGL